MLSQSVLRNTGAKVGTGSGPTDLPGVLADAVATGVVATDVVSGAGKMGKGPKRPWQFRDWSDREFREELARVGQQMDQLTFRLQEGQGVGAPLSQLAHVRGRATHRFRG